uniref:IST1-like protein n=1 Tax=Chenopodium quinoa TaxID=63459 RepID=A0A803MJT3_CHEQI
MSMLDSFFAKGFKGSKCKTLLKLSIPRIKLLRNRRELHIKQMRKDIAKLLETGQEATARIRVEHIVREENMMAAQEIIELFCELIAVRLPIIESQRECPLDLKEAISSICFAAPRCADLPELLQVQMSFAAKYGKEFVAAATELMPDCGVNRQLVELLSVRAPSAEKKLKLLKEIAEEHELEWDPSPSESELFKSHEDLLNGPRQFVSGSKVPLPIEKHHEVSQSTSVQESAAEPSESEESFDELEFPEVPKGSLRPSADAEVLAPPPQSEIHSFPLQKSNIDPEDTLWSAKHEPPKSSATPGETKQFLPFISPPSSLPSASLPVKESSPPPPPSMASKAKIDDYLNFHDSPDSDVENPFHASNDNLSAATEKLQLDDRNASGDDDVSNPWIPGEHFGNDQNLNGLKHATSDEARLESDSYPPGEHAFKQEAPYPHQPQRIPSMDDDPEFTYPNLFSSHSSGDNSQSRHGS